jgi:hypothetical protein
VVRFFPPSDLVIIIYHLFNLNNMKNFIQLSIGLLLLVLSGPAFSQFSFSAHGSHLRLGENSGISNFGGGARLEYSIDEQIIVIGGVNYYLPHNGTGSVNASSTNSAMANPNITIPSSVKIGFQQFYVGAKYYFVGDYEDLFGIYGIGEAGYLRAPTRTFLGEYDSENYRPSQEDGYRETFSDLTINLGVGVEVDLLFAYLFGDVKANLPANQRGNMIVQTEIPASLSFHVGLRFPLYHF